MEETSSAQSSKRKKNNLDSSLPLDLPSKTTTDTYGNEKGTITAGHAQRIIYKKFLDVYVKRFTVLDQNLHSLYSLVWG